MSQYFDMTKRMARGALGRQPFTLLELVQQSRKRKRTPGGSNTHSRKRTHRGGASDSAETLQPVETSFGADDQPTESSATATTTPTSGLTATVGTAKPANTATPSSVEETPAVTEEAGYFDVTKPIVVFGRVGMSGKGEEDSSDDSNGFFSNTVKSVQSWLSKSPTPSTVGSDDATKTVGSFEATKTVGSVATEDSLGSIATNDTATASTNNDEATNDTTTASTNNDEATNDTATASASTNDEATNDTASASTNDEASSSASAATNSKVVLDDQSLDQITECTQAYVATSFWEDHLDLKRVVQFVQHIPAGANATVYFAFASDTHQAYKALKEVMGDATMCASLGVEPLEDSKTIPFDRLPTTTHGLWCKLTR